MKTITRAIPLLAGLVCLALASCKPSSESSILPPPNPVLTGGLGWVVVKEAYVRLKDGPTREGRDLTHLRRGGVYEITGRERSFRDKAGDKGLWYRLKADDIEGWARESELDIHKSREQAERAASVR